MCIRDRVEFVKKENDDFSKIKYGGQEGFVMTKYLTEDANIAIQQAGNKNAKPAEPVQHATGSSDVSVKFTMYVFNVQNSIYLRKYAEENSENICTIPWGEPVGYIEDVTNGFYKIKKDKYYATHQDLSLIHISEPTRPY